MKKIFIILLLLSISSYSVSEINDKKLIKVYLADKTEKEILNLLKLNLDIANYNKASKSFDIIVSDDELTTIYKMNFTTEIKISSIKKYDDTLKKSGYFEHFHNYERMLQDMQSAANNHPNIAKLYNIGDSWEKTQGIADRDIWAIKISDNVQVEEDEAEILIMGCHHAREIITPEIVLYYMNLLIQNYGDDPYLTYLINNRQIWLVPNVNPDGHHYVFNYDSFWRKNRRDNGDGSFGVDLNRNYSFKWGLFDNWYVSSTPSDEVYRGIAPFSEPELIAIKELVESKHFTIAISFHSYAREVLYPWGYINQYTSDHETFTSLADSMVAYNGYGRGTSWESLGSSYLTNGDSDDWFYGEQTSKNKIFGLTPEVGTSFHPDTSEIMLQIEENIGPLIYTTYAAGEEPLINHTPVADQEGQGPYPVAAKVLSPIVLTTAVPLDESTIKLFYSTTAFAPFDSVFMTPTGNSDEFSGGIPPLGITGDIYYYFSASDQNGKIGKSPRGAPTDLHSFCVGADTEAPVINHTPLADGSIYSTAFVISAIITDNIGISSVKLFYRKNTNPLDSLNMTSLSSIQNGYAGIITVEDVVAGDYYEYKIVAQDISINLNTTQLPDSGFFRINIKNSILYDFELESAFTTGTGSDWQWGTPTSGPNNSHSGSKVWATNLSGNYSDLAESILETPEISLTDKDSSKLSFWHWYVNEYSSEKFWDGGNVKISVDGGQFQLIEPEDGYDGIIDDYNTFLGHEQCFGGAAANGNFWHQEIFDLTAYTDHSVQFRFHFASDASTTEPGWYIDDVEILFKDASAVKLDDKLTSIKPAKFDLSQNYPNPFNPTTEIKYSLAEAGKVALEIFNTLGQRVKTLVEENKVAGTYSAYWQGDDDQQRNVASGIYLYKLKITGSHFNKVFMKKMIKLQ